MLSGPNVAAVTPLTVINQTFDYINVQFNEPINPATFSTSNVSIQGPAGAVALRESWSLPAVSTRSRFPR